MKVGESKAITFKRLAARRTNNAIKQIRLIGNLSNRQNYVYKEDDFRNIFRVIENEVKLAKSRFMVSLNKEKKFKL